MLLDKTDLKLIGLLQNDSKQTTKQLSLQLIWCTAENKDSECVGKVWDMKANWRIIRPAFSHVNMALLRPLKIGTSEQRKYFCLATAIYRLLAIYRSWQLSELLPSYQLEMLETLKFKYLK